MSIIKLNNTIGLYSLQMKNTILISEDLVRLRYKPVKELRRISV